MMKHSQDSYGNVWVSPTGVGSGGFGVDIGTAGEGGGIYGSTLEFQDFAMMALTPGSTLSNPSFEGANTGTSPTTTLDHWTVIDDASDRVFEMFETGGTIKNSVVFGNSNVLVDNNDAGCAALTLDYNTFHRVPAGAGRCSGASCPLGCTHGSDTIFETGPIAFTAVSIPNLTIDPLSTSAFTVGDDGLPRGALVAGPSNWTILEKIYPPLMQRGRPGVCQPGYCLDSDGDEIYDRHDNCDTKYNPLQLSSESCE